MRKEEKVPVKSLNTRETIERIRERLSQYQPLRFEFPGAIPAAVLILFTDRAGEPHLIFTRRTEDVDTHKGQISFPGGSRDASDQSLLITALRETEEEIGVDPTNIEVLGQLDDFLTVTDFLISPFVGYLKNQTTFKLSSQEVAELLIVPFSVFLTDQHFEVKKWEYRQRFYDVYFYYYGKHVIWGATAFILNRVIDVVFGYNPAPNPVYRDPRNLHYLLENKHRSGTR